MEVDTWAPHSAGLQGVAAERFHLEVSMPDRMHVTALLLALALPLGSCRGDVEERPDRSRLPAFPAEQATIRIRGKVTWKGAMKPRRRPLPITVPGVAEVENPKWEVDEKSGGVPHAFVEILGVEERWRFPDVASDSIARLVQEEYRYTPWTLGLRIGQPLEVLNRDDVLHNLKWTGRKNGNANQNLPKDETRRIRFSRAEVVRFQCDVHNWMDAWIYVREHPIFAITSKDGSFELPALPPGTYEIRALHPNPSWEGEARRIEIRDGSDSQVQLTIRGVS